jgi:acetylornithine deacetylase/succinyl-diaminopimelate desuccinylase-like protein
MMSPADRVASRVQGAFEQSIATLSSYLRVPSISADKAHAKDVHQLASRIQSDLQALGLERARVLELDGALPVVAAEWKKAGPDKPTVLVYGHFDIQPVRGEVWNTPPHEPTRIGDRLFARGAADDMGGWVSHLVAIKGWIDETGGLPCNLKLLIEGEEEIGSPNLERFMDAYPDAFEADCMVLTDCENPSIDVPGLTISLRGLLEVELTCKALDADIHSGMWGGMVPDVSVALAVLISRLVDADGRMKIARRTIDAATRKAGWALPVDLDTIRKGGHLRPGVAPLPDRGVSPAEWMWWQPSVTIVATTLPTRDVKKNALRQQGSATLSVRLAPGQTVAEMMEALREVLLADPPGGVQVSVETTGTPGEGWLYTPKGPAFPAADRAYEKAWGTKLVPVGVGGSIPFVALFGRRYGEKPLILNGVMDPETTAHGPNESLHLGVFDRAIRANVYLYDELGALGV